MVILGIYFVEGLRKSTEPQNNCLLCQESNLGPLEYKVRLPTIIP
jgi:hypothetical protein